MGKTKAKEVYCPNTCSTWNIKGTSLNWKEMTLNGNKKTCSNYNLTGKCTYIIKAGVQSPIKQALRLKDKSSKNDVKFQ